MLPDFRQIFDGLPGCYLLLAPDGPRFTILGATDAYLRATMTQRAAIVGRGVFEVFPDNPGDPTKAVDFARASFQRAVDERQPVVMGIRKHDIRRPESEGGGFEERFWDAVNYPVLGSDGQVNSIILRVEDVTESVRLKQKGAEDEEANLALRQEIAERKKAEEALRHGEERFRALVSATSQVVFRMSPDGSEMLELQGGGFVADTVKPTRDWLGYIYPDDRKLVSDAVDEAVRTGIAVDLEHRGLRRDGTVAWMSSRAVPVRNAAGEVLEWFGASSDITDRKRADETLRETSKRFQTILDHAPVAIFVKDREGRYILGNRRVERFTGRPLELTMGNTDYDWSPPEDADRWRENDLKVLKSGRVWEFEETGTDVEGRQYVNLSLKFPLTDGAGTPVAVCGISTDISERKRNEQALLDEDRRKDEFIAILSHELRNPLAPIRYALPLIEREVLGDAAARAVAVIGRQVDHLTRLVDDLLDVSRISGGRIELRREQATLRSILTAATEAASPAILAGRHTLTTAVPDEPIWIHADPARIAQVVTNLLNNSATYTPGGGQIALEAGREDGHAVIRVRDNGIGLPAEAVPTLFEMFRQVSRPDKTPGGLGIGLAISRRLVEMHDGSIEALSTGVGQGSEFVVRLPVAANAGPDAPANAGPDAPANAGPDAPAAAVGGVPARVRRLKVLVVDDNADLVEMLGAVIECAGHEVRTALDGPSAIAAAVASRPDVVLLDLGMPGMGGIEVARELRRRPELAGVRLVALTGWGQADDRRRTEEAGFDHHLTKPTDPQQLERLLAQFAEELSQGSTVEGRESRVKGRGPRV